MSCGLVMLLTGPGKGKTSAAMGLALRNLGHGRRVGIVQFIKGKWPTGEEILVEKFPDQIDLVRMGEGFTWDRDDPAGDRELAQSCWKEARNLLNAGKHDLVIWDEIHIVLRYNYLDVNDVLEALRDRPDGPHVVLTGRDAPDELIAVADTVTELGDVRHHYRAGVKAQKGIEF